jgi:3-oxoacyl-[acyl-carrier protein] reductase
VNHDWWRGWGILYVQSPVGALDGKVAIVTGAGRGIGRGEALALAAEGATVVVNDLGTSLDGARETSLADEVASEIRERGGNATTNTDDVSSWSGAQALIASTVDEFGRLDVLVNNAGVLRDTMSFKMDEDAWDAVIRVHLKGHFATTRFASEHWRAQSKAGNDRGGRIVNTVSEAGLYGGTGQANYAAAKAGIAGMTIALARELKNYGVTVNAIAPRARTRMTETVLGDYGAPPEGDAFDEWDPENIGPVVAWLASDDAADVTGQVFVVFGGRLHLMHGWTMVSEIEQNERWSVGAIAARKAELFGEHRPGAPRMGFGR